MSETKHPLPPDFYDLAARHAFTGLFESQPELVCTAWKCLGKSGEYHSFALEYRTPLIPPVRKRRYSKDFVPLTVSRAMVDGARARYEAETGKCSNCAGSGHKLTEFGIHGDRWGECPKCHGSGLPEAKP